MIDPIFGIDPGEIVYDIDENMPLPEMKDKSLVKSGAEH